MKFAEFSSALKKLLKALSDIIPNLNVIYMSEKSSRGKMKEAKGKFNDFIPRSGNQSSCKFIALIV